MRHHFLLLWIVGAGLVGLIVGAAVTGWYFTRYQPFHPPAPARPYAYTDNTYYQQQVAYMRTYRQTGAIVMLGDSHFSRVSWNGLLQRNDVINQGISGDIAEGLLHRLSLVYDCHPVLCFIEIGTNDISFRIPVAHTTQLIREVADSLMTHHIQPVICTIPKVVNAYKNQQIDSCNQLLVRMGRPMIRLDTLLQRKHLLPDELHITANGYLLIRDRLQQVLKSHGL